MGHRIEKPQMVSWTETREITVGHHNCGVCGVETPGPTMDQLVAFAKGVCNEREYLWPSDEQDEEGFPEGYMPPGWTDEGGDRGLICPDCTAAKEAAFAARRVQVGRVPVAYAARACGGSVPGGLGTCRGTIRQAAVGKAPRCDRCDAQPLEWEA